MRMGEGSEASRGQPASPQTNKQQGSKQTTTTTKTIKQKQQHSPTDLSRHQDWIAGNQDRGEEGSMKEEEDDEQEGE